MEFIKEHFYLITLKIGFRILTFDCRILADDGIYVSFIDKFGKQMTYKKDIIIGWEEKNV